uniref:Uncharacterized protein n=1 Tax=Strigamia maritima TaxID=126957 RepID=T1JMJ5_STRMM
MSHLIKFGSCSLHDRLYPPLMCISDFTSLEGDECTTPLKCCFCSIFSPSLMQNKKYTDFPIQFLLFIYGGTSLNKAKYCI